MGQETTNTRISMTKAADALPSRYRQLVQTLSCTRCQGTGLVQPPRNYSRPPVFILGKPDEYCDCKLGIYARQREERLDDQMRVEIPASRRVYLQAGLTLPPRCEAFTLESSPLRNTHPHNKTLAFLDEWDGRRNLAYFGDTGVGKTGLVVGVLKALMPKAAAEGWQMTFVSVTTFFGQLQHGFEDKTYQQTLDRACKVKLLCLDDIGAEQPSDWKRSLFYELLNRRYEAQLPTFLTTNYNLAQLEEHLTHRVFDRLMEHCAKISVTGKSQRVRGA